MCDTFFAAGPSGLQNHSRKRMCTTCESSSEAPPKRTRLHNSLANSHEMINQLHISTSVPQTPTTYSFPILPTCTPPGTPPHVPMMAYGAAHIPGMSYGGANTPGASYGSLQSISRHSPPLCSTIQRPSNVSLVGSTGPMMSTTHTSRGLSYSNPPLTESQYGSIPTTSQQVRG